jgi:hypothetical protein
MAPSDIPVNQEEMRTVREVMREIGAMLQQLERGDLSKIVIMSPGAQMRGVLVSVEKYAALAENERTPEA